MTGPPQEPLPGMTELDPELAELNASLPEAYHAWRWAGRWYVRRERSSPAWVISRDTAAEIRAAVAEREAQ